MTKIRLSITLTIVVMMFVIPSAFSESVEIKKVPFNAHVDEVYEFSILPPTGWIIESPYVDENPKVPPALFGAYLDNPNNTYDPLMTIDFTSNPEIWDHLDNTDFSNPEIKAMFDHSNMNILLDAVVNGYSDDFVNTSQTKILEKSVNSFQDGYMTRVVTTKIILMDEEAINTNSVFVDVWRLNGDHFNIFFTVRTEQYDTYVDIFNESLDTFYLGKVEKLSSPKPNFIDPEKDPQYYLDRYYNEPEYKTWFNRNYPDYTIEEVVGVSIQETKTIPEWIKGIFAFYVEGQIDDGELIKALQFLIKEGIIEV